MVKVTTFMFLLSIGLLLLLAYLVSLVEQQETVARIGIVLVYVISCFAGGLIVGKCKQKRKFLWGMLAGLVYLVILIALSVAVGCGEIPPVSFLLTSSMLCLCSGMLGGMLA